MKQIQKHRERMGFTVADLAAYAGVHQRTVKDLESGESRKVQDRVQRGLCKALRVKPKDLFDSKGVAK